MSNLPSSLTRERSVKGELGSFKGRKCQSYISQLHTSLFILEDTVVFGQIKA